VCAEAHLLSELPNLEHHNKSQVPYILLILIENLNASPHIYDAFMRFPNFIENDMYYHFFLKVCRH
jgi:hypothetical protein